jgi:hypothetical protein
MGILGEVLKSRVGHEQCVLDLNAAEPEFIKRGFNVQHHSRLKTHILVGANDWRIVDLKADPMAKTRPAIAVQTVSTSYVTDHAINLGSQHPGTNRLTACLLSGKNRFVNSALSSGRLANDPGSPSVREIRLEDTAVIELHKIAILDYVVGWQRECK